MTSSTLQQLRFEFHNQLLETILTASREQIPSIADKSNNFSIAVALGILKRLGWQGKGVDKSSGQTAGNSF